MPLTVSIMFADNTPIGAGVSLDLLDGTAVVASALTSDGEVTFDADPSALAKPRLKLSAQQSTRARTPVR